MAIEFLQGKVEAKDWHVVWANQSYRLVRNDAVGVCGWMQCTSTGEWEPVVNRAFDLLQHIGEFLYRMEQGIPVEPIPDEKLEEMLKRHDWIKVDDRTYRKNGWEAFVRDTGVVFKLAQIEGRSFEGVVAFDFDELAQIEGFLSREWLTREDPMRGRLEKLLTAGDWKKASNDRYRLGCWVATLHESGVRFSLFRTVIENHIFRGTVRFQYDEYDEVKRFLGTGWFWASQI